MKIVAYVCQTPSAQWRLHGLLTNKKYYDSNKQKQNWEPLLVLPPPGPGNLKIQTNFLQLLSQIRAFYRPAILKSGLFQASTTKTIHNWDIYRTILIKLNSDLSFLIYMNYSVFQTKVRNSGIIRATLTKWPKFGFWPNFTPRTMTYLGGQGG